MLVSSSCAAACAFFATSMFERASLLFFSMLTREPLLFQEIVLLYMATFREGWFAGRRHSQTLLSKPKSARMSVKSLPLHRNRVEQKQMDENLNILQTSALGTIGFYTSHTTLGLRPWVVYSVGKPSWPWFVIIGSAEALPILCVRYFRWERERERERYRDRRKWRHHCRAKIGDEFTKSSHKGRRVYTFPCQKFALFVSLFTLPVSPFWNGDHCGAEIRNEFTLPLPKDFFLLVPNLSNGASRATSNRKLKTNDQILPSPTLFFSSKNWIQLIPKTIGNRKRDCAWGGSGW